MFCGIEEFENDPQINSARILKRTLFLENRHFLTPNHDSCKSVQSQKQPFFFTFLCSPHVYNIGIRVALWDLAIQILGCKWENKVDLTNFLPCQCTCDYDCADLYMVWSSHERIPLQEAFSTDYFIKYRGI